MDYSMLFDPGLASRLPINPSLRSSRRGAAIGGIADLPRASLAAGTLVLALALSGNERDRLPGDVERLYRSGCRPGDDFLHQGSVFREGVRFSRHWQRIRQNGRRIQHEHADRPLETG